MIALARAIALALARPRSTAALARVQTKRLARAVHHAHASVPFYRERAAATGFDPHTIASPSDLARFPLLDGETARRAIRAGSLLADDTPRASLQWFPSSGTTGEPFHWPRGSDERTLWRAMLLRLFRRLGVSLRCRVAQLDPAPGKAHLLQRLGWMPTTWIDPALSVPAQAERLFEARADVLLGTPTRLRRIAAALLAQKRVPAPVKAVIGAGEVLDATTSGRLAAVFGPTPIEVYGATELGYLAIPCAGHGAFHVNADVFTVELLDDAGRPARAGEIGRVVVTDLLGRTAPLLRYDTGDLARVPTAPCPCGDPMPTIGPIEGRADDMIVTADGRCLTTRTMLAAFSGIAEPGTYELIEEAPHRYVWVARSPAAERARATAAALLAVPLESIRVEERELPARGKTRVVIRAQTARENRPNAALRPGDRSPVPRAP